MKKTVFLLAVLSLGTLGWARSAWPDATGQFYCATSQAAWSPLGSFGGSGADGVGAAKTDADGNLYVTGFFSSTASFQKQALVSLGDHDMYLAKFDPHGQLRWIVQAGGSGLDEGSDLAFDAKGNIYVAGWFSDSATFQSANGEKKTVSGYVHENPFLVKYSPSGKLLWLRRGGSLDFDTGNNRAWGLTVNPKTGSIYMTGYAEGTTYFSTSTGPDQPVAGTFGWHIFLVKYDTEGNFHWGLTNLPYGNSIAYKVAVDRYDSVYVVGWFEGGATFSSRDGSDQFVSGFSTPGPPDAAQDVFLVKYDGKGNLKWVNHAGGYRAIADNLALSDDGKITITGVIGNISTGSSSQAETIFASQPGGVAINLGGGQLTDPYNWDMFLATYDSSGVLNNATRIGGTGQDFGAGITYDRQGNLYVTGIFSGLVDFGGITLNGSAANNVFVVKYREHGAGLAAAWAEAIVGAGSVADYQESGPRVWVDTRGPGIEIIVTGTYQGTAKFGGFKLNSAGDDDIYLIRLNQKHDN